VILFFGVAQGVLLFLALLFNKRGRRLTNVLLSALLISTAASIVPWWLTASGAIGRAPYSMYLAYLSTSAVGPLCYFYTRCSLYHDYKPRIHHIAAFALAPGLIAIATLIHRGIDAGAIAARAELLMTGQPVPFRLSDLGTPLVYAVYKTVFLCLAWRHVVRAQKSMGEHFGDAGRRHAFWLKALTGGLLVIVAGCWFAMMLFVVATGRYTVSIEYSIALLRCLTVQMIAVAAFMVPEALSTTLSEPRRRRPIDDVTATRHLRNLRACMETDKLYRDKELRLVDLAERLSLPAYVLSQLMNEHLKVNFLDFINRYRVEEASRLLEDAENDRFTLLALAQDAGFKSRASFNRIFKKHTGMPPSEYRRARGRAIE
jgi:AraC-like DNA-binding protein